MTANSDRQAYCKLHNYNMYSYRIVCWNYKRNNSSIAVHVRKVSGGGGLAP